MTFFCDVHQVYGHPADWHAFAYRRRWIQTRRALYGRQWRAAMAELHAMNAASARYLS